VLKFSGRVIDVSRIVLKNFRMRKVHVVRFKLSLFHPATAKTSKLVETKNFLLERSFTTGSTHSITFNSNNFATAVTLNVEIKVDHMMTIEDDLRRHLMAEQANPHFVDTTIECNNVHLLCHGFMLAARSSVFRAYLQQPGFSEGKTRIIRIRDLDMGTVRELVNFIYTESFEPEDAFSLFSAADKYDIPMLKKECALVMMDDLEVQNAAECLQVPILPKVTTYTDYIPVTLYRYFMAGCFFSIILSQ
jgi:hypothetical protein